MADNVVETIFVKLGLDGSEYNKEVDKTKKSNDKLNKSVGETDKVVSSTAKTLGKFFGVLATATGVAKMVSEVAKLNDELYHLEKNLNISSKDIKSWQGAAGAMGGSAEGMTSSMQSLSKSITDFKMRGDTSMLPAMSAIGVSMVDAQGKARKTTDVMLDLADSFSKMDRQQALSLSQDLGMDEGTFNTLVQGRQEMEKMIKYQETMYKSSEKELESSRNLQKNRALIGQQWESMKTLLANALIPFFVKLSEVALGMFEYLQKHQQAIQSVFKGIAFVVGVVLTPVLIKAAIAALAFIAPFAPFILVVTALGAAFGLLYDDYKTWAEGGKSLFDWGAFTDYINNAKVSTDSLKSAFLYLATGYSDWSTLAEDGKAWLKLKGFIDENGVSVRSLGMGFKNLAVDMVSNVMPTLRGYASIMQKLMSGDFGGAAAEAGQMLKNLVTNEMDRGKSWLDRIGGAVDIATGNEVGTASSTNIMAKGKPTAGFSPDKAKTIKAVASRLGINPNDLASVISFETGGSFNPASKNPKSSATGLIQFMKGSGGTKGSYYGMSREQFGGLGFDAQMQYVEKYFKERGFKQGGRYTTGDVYGAVTGYGYKKGSKEYDLNKVWDSNKDGVISKGEMVQNPSFRAHQREYFPSGGASQAQASMRQGSTLPNTIAKPQASNNRTDVKIGDIKVFTTASTISGVAKDAAGAFGSQVGMLTPTSR